MQKTTRRSGSVIFFCARYWIKNICFIYPDGSKYFYRTHARIVQFAVDSENITRVLKHARSSSNAIFQLHKLTVQTFTCSGSIQSSALFFLPLYYSVFSFFYPLLAPSFFFFFFLISIPFRSPEILDRDGLARAHGYKFDGGGRGKRVGRCNKSDLKKR